MDLHLLDVSYKQNRTIMQCGFPVFPTLFEKTVFSPLNGFGTLVKKSFGVVHMYFFISILFHWSISVFITVPHFMLVL